MKVLKALVITTIALALVPVAAVATVVLVGIAQAALLALGAFFAVAWVVAMGWYLARGNPAAWREVRDFLREARRFWAEAPWLVVGLGLLVLFFVALAMHAIVLPLWKK